MLREKMIRLRKLLQSDKSYISNEFQAIFGYQLDLKQPRTYNEKIAWLKIFEMGPEYSRFVDKISVRDFVKERVGEHILIPMYDTFESAHDVHEKNIDNEQFVVKASHDSGTVFICDERAEFDWVLARENLEYCLNRDFYELHREKQYKGIKPRVIVEKLLLNEAGEIPPDYKFHYSNGNLIFIQVDSDRFGEHTRSLFNESWEPISCEYVYRKSDSTQLPEQKEKMLMISKMLASDFKFVRVDLYESDGEIYFGELTFTPEAGRGKFSPIEFDEFFGGKIAL